MVLCGFNEVRASNTSDVCIKIFLMVSVGGSSWSIECLENTIGTSCKYRVEIVWNFFAFSLPVVIQLELRCIQEIIPLDLDTLHR